MKIKLLDIETHKVDIITDLVHLIRYVYPDIKVDVITQVGMKTRRRKQTAMLFNPINVAAMDDDTLRWDVGHQFGHLLYAEATKLPQFTSYTCMSIEDLGDFARLNMHRPEEVFAEIFAASFLKPAIKWPHRVIQDTYKLVKENS